TTAPDQSLQLQGTGNHLGDFTWAGPITNTKAAPNTGQTFVALVNSANSIVVTKTADTNDGVCDADCSLREAILAATGDPGAETITFNIPPADPGCSGGVCTINLTSGLPAVREGTSIIGPGSGLLIVARNSTNLFLIFETRSSTQIAITGLSITNGALADRFFHGAGLSNNGVLSLSDVVISGNAASAGSMGGGIDNRDDPNSAILTASLTIDSSLIQQNTACGSFSGTCSGNP